MSRHRKLLRIAELVALLLFCFYVGIDLTLALRILRPDDFVPEMILVSEGLALTIFFVSVMLLAEYSRIVRPAQSWWSRNTVSYPQTWALLRWCPLVFKATILPIGAIAFVSLFWIGGARWSGGPMSTHQLVVFATCNITFCGVSVLVCASVSRMPGSLAETFGPMERA